MKRREYTVIQGCLLGQGLETMAGIVCRDFFEIGEFLGSGKQVVKKHARPIQQIVAYVMADLDGCFGRAEELADQLNSAEPDYTINADGTFVRND